MEDYQRVNCSECGGDCKTTCVESGLPSQGGLITSPEDLERLRARVPLLNAQRFQRQQLHDLIDEAEKIGAWLYSPSTRPSRPAGTWAEFPKPDYHKARDMIGEEISRWYSPARLRSLLTAPSAYHPEDFYGFRWTLAYPGDGLREIGFIVNAINEAYAAFEASIQK